MKECSVITIIDNLSNNVNDVIQKFSGISNKKKTFSEMVNYLEANYEFEYILWIANPNNIDEEHIEKVKEELKDNKNVLFIDIKSKEELDSIPKLLKNVENINMCVIEKKYIHCIEQENNLGHNIDLLFTELILKAQDIKILNRDIEVKDYNVKVNLDSYIRKILQFVALYEEQEKYTYYEIRYIKDLRIIINELKKILDSKNKVIEYLKKLQPFAKEIINVDCSELEVIEKLFIYQVGNKEFESAFKTLRYLNKEEQAVIEEIESVKEKENQFYKLKYEEILSSKSWAITKPLRMPKIWMKKIKKKLKGQ